MSVEGEVVGMATRVGVEITSSPPKCDKKSALDELLGDTEEGENEGESGIGDECKRYFTERLLPRNSDPLEWWKLNQFRFPHVAAVATSVFAVQATSTSSERLFSTAGF